MSNMYYLIAAYSAVWLVIALYLVVLIVRNGNLKKMVSSLEQRVSELESRQEKIVDNASL